MPSGLPAGACGDGHLDYGEVCDGANLNDHDCTTLGQGYTGGTLRCLTDCSDLDTSGCVSLPGCGNQALDASEICDGPALGDASCRDLGYSGGQLACAADCSRLLDRGCYHHAGTCGNGVVEWPEECDGQDFGEYATCNDLDTSFTAGDLRCTADCVLDLEGCTGDLCESAGLYGDGVYCDPCERWGGSRDPDCDLCALADGECPSWMAFGLGSFLSTCLYETGAEDPDCGVCGNGQYDGMTEYCDGGALESTACTDLPGFTSGTVACADNCSLDTSGCYACGNGIVSGPEACDGADLGGATCASQGFTGGTLGCRADCTDLDRTGCTGGCGNGVLEGAEVCDGTAIADDTCVDHGYLWGELVCAPGCASVDPVGCYSRFELDPSVVFDWIDVSATGTPVSLDDDEVAGPFPVGFTFHFFGAGFAQFHLGSNGVVTFEPVEVPSTNACPVSDPDALPYSLALLWDDLDPSWTGDRTYYQHFDACPSGPAEPCLVIQYQDYHHYSQDEELAGTFQAVLFATGSVRLQYLDAGARAGSTATIGVMGPAGERLIFGCDTTGLTSDGLALCFRRPTSSGC